MALGRSWNLGLAFFTFWLAYASATEVELGVEAEKANPLICFSLQSAFKTDMYLGYNGKVRKSSVIDTFSVERGVSGTGISIRSCQQRAFYLVPIIKGGKKIVKLEEKGGTDEWKASASWIRRSDRFLSGFSGFESVSFVNHYLFIQSDNKMVLRKMRSTSSFKKQASFYLINQAADVRQILMDKAKAYWRFDESKGTKIYDSMPNKESKRHHGRVSGNVTMAQPGVVNPNTLIGRTAIQFSQKKKGFVNIPYSSHLNPGQDFSYEFWHKWEGGKPSWQCLISNRANEWSPKKIYGGFALYLNRKGKYVLWVGEKTKFNNIRGSPADRNKWTHVVISYTRTTQAMRLIINGDEVAMALVNLHLNQKYQLRIGAGGNERAKGAQFYHGLIDEVQFYDKVLTAAQLRAHRQRCPKGFQSTEKGCKDVDECTATKNGGCPKESSCINKKGYFVCTKCPTKFVQLIGHLCEDVDECKVDNGGCAAEAKCHNEFGRPVICDECPPGFTGDGYKFCSDIDECVDGNGGCDPLTKCHNLQGQRICGHCPEGYEGNGDTGCKDIDECQKNHGGCDPLTKCRNSIGGRNCGPCPLGYAGNGENGCLDLNECVNANGGCDPVVECINIPGSYRCGRCPDGWSGDGYEGCKRPKGEANSDIKTDDMSSEEFTRVVAMKTARKLTDEVHQQYLLHKSQDHMRVDSQNMDQKIQEMEDRLFNLQWKLKLANNKKAEEKKLLEDTREKTRKTIKSILDEAQNHVQRIVQTGHTGPVLTTRNITGDGTPNTTVSDDTQAVGF